MHDKLISLKYAEDRTFKIGIRDLLSAPVDAIVNPANGGLSHGGGLAAVISEEAGPELDDECSGIIAKIGRIPVTLAVPTRAYSLPFKGIIHAVGPRMGDGGEKGKLIKTIGNALLLAGKKGWKSVGFPAISAGIYGVPNEICAEAFKIAVPAYWEGRLDSKINLVWLCLTKNLIDDFYKVFMKK